MAGRDGQNGDAPRDPRSDRVYLGILFALMATVFAAAAVAIVGGEVYHDEGLKQGGFWVALVAGAGYFGFRIWGRVKAAQDQRERRRRALAESPEDDDGAA
jgi:hypothetical protein